jgi:tuberculosinol/isotuberculosinol synthase
MDLEAFLALPTEEVARLVRERGPKVCVFPVNGTRRWLMLEHPDEVRSDFVRAYLEIVAQRMIRLFSMLFDHGIHTLLSPLLGPDVLQRPDEYLELVAVGLLWFVRSAECLRFYETYDVRARVYGDAARHMANIDASRLQSTFQELAETTAGHRRHRLFFGVCAHDAAESVAEFGAAFKEAHARPPNRREIVEGYYGEYVTPVDLFIGSGSPAAFDMPLLATGHEDLYFMVAPTPYLSEQTLRSILYDHMYSRRVEDRTYHRMTSDDWGALREYYAVNRQGVLGLGRQHGSRHYWYPLPQVTLSSMMRKA